MRNWGVFSPVITSYSIHYTKLYELASSVALVSSPYLKALYDKYFTESPRDFIELLQFCIHFNVEQSRLEATVEGLVRLCGHRITTGKITAILGNKTTESLLPVSDNSEITVQSKKFVITSYSIHYTKLYDCRAGIYIYH